jgi:hypothetical protein
LALYLSQDPPQLIDFLCEQYFPVVFPPRVQRRHVGSASVAGGKDVACACAYEDGADDHPAKDVDNQVRNHLRFSFEPWPRSVAGAFLLGGEERE